jgi:ribosome-binding factor A
MSESPRVHRVADILQAEITDILRRRMKDPRLGFVTVTDVTVTRDLRTATVHVSALTEDELEASLELLRGAKGFLRSELGKRVHLRHVPDLVFRGDRSAERGRRMEDLLRDLREEGSLPDEESDPA